MNEFDQVILFHFSLNRVLVSAILFITIMIMIMISILDLCYPLNLQCKHQKPLNLYISRRFHLCTFFLLAAIICMDIYCLNLSPSFVSYLCSQQSLLCFLLLKGCKIYSEIDYWVFKALIKFFLFTRHFKNSLWLVTWYFSWQHAENMTFLSNYQARHHIFLHLESPLLCLFVLLENLSFTN